ncbi:MAG TPA: ankyrin repeat domain-containing protein [Spirochaetota bacterium]|nr:ankyrin repeat domain-containing protein [Spirochaetota bacterium]
MKPFFLVFSQAIILLGLLTIPAIARERADINSRLLNAIARNDIKEVSAILYSHPDLNTEKDYMTNPLAVAAFHENTEIMRLLVSNGANVDIKINTEYPERPLILQCAHTRKINAVRILIELGADINAVDYMNISALYDAARWGDMEMVKLLVDNGADVNHTRKENVDGEADTPLRRAVMNEHDDIAVYLRNHGAH